MSELLNTIEKEVVEEFSQQLKTGTSINTLILQIATISAKVTKSFIEKYENEKNL